MEYTVPDGRTQVTCNLEMQSDTQALEDVVVIAYGVRKKGTIAGSVSTVKAEKIETTPTAAFDQALQGQVPGLTVLSSSGEPSKSAELTIRGTNSINAGTDPLFVLDGIVISASDFNAINPADIESLSVLKDASSTSIYGARAANGVVVITTKRGRMADRPVINYRMQLGISQLAHGNWDLMNTAERIQYEKEIGLTEGKNYSLLSQTDVNWLDEVFSNNALLQNYELSVSGATEKTNYYVSGGYYDQEGIAPGSDFSRYSLRANIEQRAAKWLKVGTNTLLNYQQIELAQSGEYTVVTPISAARFMMPYWNPRRPDGSIASMEDGSWKGEGQNPLEWIENNPVHYKKYKVISSLFAEATPIEGLTIKSQFSADYSHSTGFGISYPEYYPNLGIGTAARNTSDGLTLSVTNTVNYRFRVHEDHSFNFLVGQEGIDYHYESFGVTTQGQNNDKLTSITTGTRATTWEDEPGRRLRLPLLLRPRRIQLRGPLLRRLLAPRRRLVALRSLEPLGRILVGGVHVEHAQRAFPGERPRMADQRPDHDFDRYVGQLLDPQLRAPRAGQGRSGTRGDRRHSPLHAGQRGAELGNHVDHEPLGLHFGFWNRLTADLEFYHKKTSDMLMSVPQSYTNGGFGFRWDNIGAMVNRGVELNLTGTVISTRDFAWSLNANVSYNHNEITELYNGVREYEIASSDLKYVVGHSIGEFYMNRYAGVNPANGDALWYTKDGKLTNELRDEDKVMIGKSFIAPWQGGFGTNLSWKGIALSAQFSWIADRWVMNNDRYFDESNGRFASYNQSKRLLHRWKQPGDVTDIPRHGVYTEFDTRLLEDASFLRLKNLMLSYTFPRELLRKTRFISGVRIYAQAQNLLTFTNFSGLDPEGNGNTYAAEYPMTRQFTFGLDLTF